MKVYIISIFEKNVVPGRSDCTIFKSTVSLEQNDQIAFLLLVDTNSQ